MHYDELYYDEVDVPEPGVGEAYGHGFKQLWPNFLMLFIVFIISWVLGFPAWMMSGAGDIGSMIVDDAETGAAVAVGGMIALAGYLFSFSYGILVTNPVNYGISYCFLRAARGERLEIPHMFAAFRNYLSAVIACVLTGFIIGLGMLFLIIPGIYFACKLVFVPFLVVDKKLGPIASMQRSWEMTNGHAWTVFWMGLLAIPICFAGILCLIVGIIPAMMWIGLAFASLYYAVEFDDDAEDAIYV